VEDDERGGHPKWTLGQTLLLLNFIELNLLCTTQLTVVFYNWLHQQHVSALLGHHQANKD